MTQKQDTLPSPQAGLVRETQERALATKKALLLTAERLYARRGIDGVSLREINREAQQKNRSAVHYHFGSREAVIEGIFEMRAEQIDRRRSELLAQLRQKNPPATVRELIDAIIKPQAEVWRQESSPYHYNRFLAQASLSGHSELREMWRRFFGRGLNEYWICIRELLPDIPETLFRQRVAVTTDFAIYGLATLERVVEANRIAGSVFSLDRAVENLIDMLTGSIMIPASDEAMCSITKKQS